MGETRGMPMPKFSSLAAPQQAASQPPALWQSAAMVYGSLDCNGSYRGPVDGRFEGPVGGSTTPWTLRPPVVPQHATRPKKPTAATNHHGAADPSFRQGCRPCSPPWDRPRTNPVSPVSETLERSAGSDGKWQAGSSTAAPVLWSYDVTGKRRTVQTSTEDLTDLVNESLWQGIVLPSAGSFGHPHRCGPSCRYAWRASGCRNGADCLCCHLCRWQRLP